MTDAFYIWHRYCM